MYYFILKWKLSKKDCSPTFDVTRIRTRQGKFLFGGSQLLFLFSFLRRPQEDSLWPSTIYCTLSQGPTCRWHSAVGWGNAGFETGTLQTSGALYQWATTPPKAGKVKHKQRKLSIKTRECTKLVRFRIQREPRPYEHIFPSQAFVAPILIQLAIFSRISLR